MGGKGMIQFDLYNSIIDKHFKDVCFKTETVTSDGVKRNLNLIFATNASGKSTFSTIIESYFNKNEYIENRFTKSRSTMRVTVNDENFDKAYRYDRMFASKSTDFYKGELIVSPKNADVIVKKREEVDIKLKILLETYKTTKSYTILKQYSDLLKGTTVAKLAAKRFSAGSEKEIYQNLNIETPKENICDNLSIEELLDLITNDVSFLEICSNINEETIKLIKENFQDLDRDDASFYTEVLNYMTNHSNKILEKICLMCGKTVITKEILDERLEYINKQIYIYQSTISNNQFFNQLNQFLETSFSSKMFKDFQFILKSKQGEELIKTAVNIGNTISELKILELKKVGFDCVIKKVLMEADIMNQIDSLGNLFKELAKIQEENSEILNEDVKQKFTNNLIEMQFKYADTMQVQLKDDNTISITCNNIQIVDLYNEVLSESEKSILSFSLFLSIIKDYNKSIVIIDDPIDSHDQKNKWFILDKINEYFIDNKAMVIILTHDLDVSKSLNLIDSDLHYSNYILTKNEISNVFGPSLYFRDVSSFVHDVKNEIEKPTVTDNEKYLLPIGFLMRYLCKNQYKHLNEIDFLGITIPANSITRKLTKQIGYEEVSSSFVHYKANVDSAILLDNLYIILKVTRKSTSKPSYICSSIDSDKLIENNIADIVPISQYQKDIVKILTALLIRNIIEKKMRIKAPSITGRTLGSYASQYAVLYGESDPLLKFYNSNKFMIDEFAHLESGVDALLTYDIDYIKNQLNILKLII